MRPVNSNIILLAVAAATLFMSGCKKEEEVTKPYMTGELTFAFPEYARKGELLNLEASGVTYPTDIQIRWSASTIFNDTIVGSRITVRLPDSLGSFGITATAYADGYYSKTASAVVTTIDPERDSTLYGVARSPKSFADPRDGRTYGYVTVGGLDWMSQNLGWDGAGKSYHDSPVLDGFVGRYYTWNQVQNACPPGWRLPSAADWESLAKAVIGREATFFDADGWPTVGEKISAKAVFLDEPMWEYFPGNAHTNDFAWNAIPMGMYICGGNIISGFGKYAYYWSSHSTADRAYARYIFEENSTMPQAVFVKDDTAMNVRCVRNTE